MKGIKLSLANAQNHPNSPKNLKISDEALCTSVQKSLDQCAPSNIENEYRNACERLTKDLDGWFARSDDSQMSMQDRFLLGIWHCTEGKSFKTEIKSCQSSLLFANVNRVEAGHAQV